MSELQNRSYDEQICQRAECRMLREELTKVNCERLAALCSRDAYKELCYKYREALELITKESAGLIHAHEFALSADGGNSNMRCLEICIDKARKALGEVGK